MKARKPSLFDDAIYEMQAELCAALAHPIRLKILDLISTEERNNTELLEILQIPKPNLTQHLNVLKAAGLVSSRKDGVFQYCSLGFPQIKSACQAVRQMMKERLENTHNRDAALAQSLKQRRHG